MSAISDNHVDLGAYALGLLNDQDKADFEAHLATCAACTAEMATLTPVAELLKGLDPVEEPGDAAIEPPVDLLRRRAQAGRRRRRWQVAAGAAACVAALGGGLAAGTVTASGPAQPGPALAGQLHMASDASTGATGTVGLVAKSWGTQVTLDLAGVHGPVECQLIAVARNGQRKVVTGWLVPAPGDGVPGHPAHLLVQGGTAIPLGSLARFEVIVAGGPALLTIPV